MVNWTAGKTVAYRSMRSFKKTTSRVYAFYIFSPKNISFTSVSKISISLGFRPLDPYWVFAPIPHWVTSVPQDTPLLCVNPSPKVTERWRHCARLNDEKSDTYTRQSCGDVKDVQPDCPVEFVAMNRERGKRGVLEEGWKTRRIMMEIDGRLREKKKGKKENAEERDGDLHTACLFGWSLPWQGHG